MEMSWQSVSWIISYVIVVLVLSCYGLHRYLLIYLFWKHRKDKPKPVGKLEHLPVVTVQLPIYNEMHVVRRLVQKVAELDYPQHLLQIQILDDSTDETQDICREEEATRRVRWKMAWPGPGGSLFLFWMRISSPRHPSSWK